VIFVKRNTIFNYAHFLILSIVFLVILSLFSATTLAKSYQPEISGSFESGDKLYTDPGLSEDDTVDYYKYDKQWLKYRQQLAVGEYYYFKLQRQQRIYEHSQTYDNLNLETEANYTFYLTEKLRNRFKVLLRDKEYLELDYRYKDYQLARLQYSLQYDLSKKHDYELILQKQWTEYEISPENDYQLNRISFKWGWGVTENLDLDTKLQFDQQLNNSQSGSTDKNGRKLSLKFKYKL
jgi:hypothetical protein